ncbi:hypothetical protein DEU56DRAFT_759035 [Suillus clintonianus]|uniref:uncharacterized protein n=1 Tax=Suillus clintonianus TaxID=1904413 RepID=UPI001B886E7A|nr:uncharacterized protein DEU56DRAFT_759035 [Suillus clintonianus]KAG2126068.1 hypothetical protein DEU56DRAFT_759035 [Suillus clintonianus]
MTINLRALSTRASGLVDNILDPHHQHHDDTKPGTHGMDPYELLQAITSLKPANSEANLVMDLARAKREVLRAQKALAECLLRENEVLASLLRLRVDTAKNTLDDADMGLGYSMAGLIVPYLQNNVKVISAPLFGLELLDFQMQSPYFSVTLGGTVKSGEQFAFSKPIWGHMTVKLMGPIVALSDDAFASIIAEAQQYAKHAKSIGNSRTTTSDAPDEDDVFADLFAFR